MNRVVRILRSFGRFWLEFLIGDTPELFGAVVIIIVTALLLRHHQTIAVVVLPVMAVVSLVASALRGRRPRRVDASKRSENPHRE